MSKDSLVPEKNASAHFAAIAKLVNPTKEEKQKKKKEKLAANLPITAEDDSSTDSVVIGAPTGDYYYLREKGGKYYYGATDDTELQKIDADGVPVLDTLTRRGGLLSRISSDDAPGLGSFCYLISIQNLKRIGQK